MKKKIYNVDKTGLYWKFLPDRTYVASFQRTAPGSKTEKKIDFFGCTHTTGLHKLKSQAKAKNPKAFKNFKYAL